MSFKNPFRRVPAFTEFAACLELVNAPSWLPFGGQDAVSNAILGLLPGTLAWLLAQAPINVAAPDVTMLRFGRFTAALNAERS